MLNTRHNYHHSKLPAIGDIVSLPKYIQKSRHNKYIVTSYPLCDNIIPYSRGFHTCWIKSLKDGKEYKISGFYLIDQN